MEEAERIYQQERTVARRNSDLNKLSMKTIVAMWAKKLGIEEEDTNAIAEAIGVSNSTVHRWLHDGMRPRPRELGGYMRQIEMMAQRLNKSNL